MSLASSILHTQPLKKEAKRKNLQFVKNCKIYNPQNFCTVWYYHAGIITGIIIITVIIVIN